MYVLLLNTAVHLVECIMIKIIMGSKHRINLVGFLVHSFVNWSFVSAVNSLICRGDWIDRFLHRNPKLSKYICCPVGTLVMSYSLVQLALREIEFLSCSICWKIFHKWVKRTSEILFEENILGRILVICSIFYSRLRDHSTSNSTKIQRSLLNDVMECTNWFKLLIDTMNLSLFY